MNDKLTKLQQAQLKRQQAVSENTSATITTEPKSKGDLAKERFDQARNLSNAKHVLLSEIKINKQIRINFECIEEMASSIREHGVLQPIIVRPLDKGYELVAGERRCRGLKLLNDEDPTNTAFQSIPAVIRQMDDQEKLIIQVIENVQDESLQPLEEANAYQQLMDNFGLNQKQVAESVGVSTRLVSERLALLKLSPDELNQIKSGETSATKAVQNKRQNKSGGDVAKNPSKPKEASLSIPLSVAEDLCKLLKIVADKHSLSDIELSKKTTRKDLITILKSRTSEILNAETI